MEENIKILEELRKGYREIERENKLLKKVDEIVENINIKEMALKIEKDDSIPKSKVKEIVEQEAFEVHTREYGNIEVIAVENILELMEDK